MNTRGINRSVRWLLTTGLLLSVTLAGPGASVARAAGYAVINLNDSGKGSLRQAILNANAAAGADTITFSVSGTILLSSTLPAISDAAGLMIDGTGRSITISGNDAVRVMSVNSGAALALHNLTVAGGNAGSFNGGGIYNAGTLSVTDTTFSNNRVGVLAAGGGIANYGSLSVTDSIFSGNSSVENGQGGGIFSQGTLNVTGSTFSGNTAGIGAGIFSFSGTATVSNSIFSGNTSDTPDGGDAGGIYNGGTLTVLDSTFTANTAIIQGGGISNHGTLSVTNSTFSDNRANSFFSSGGGIYNSGTLDVTDGSFSSNRALRGGGIYNSGTLTLTNSSLTDNEASEEGGGISNHGTLDVSDSTFSGNIALSGGGLYNSTFGMITVANTTFSGNGRGIPGGAIYNGGTLDVTGSTFSGNIAEEGGGIYNYGPLTVTNSTFSGNSTSEFGRGGGISNYATVSVTNSTFSDNSAPQGGAIYNYAILNAINSTFQANGSSAIVGGIVGGGIFNNTTGTLTVTKSTFSDNTTLDSGGGIRNDGTLHVMDSTFSVNSAEFGGAIYNGGILDVTDSTFSGNAAEYGGGIDNLGMLEVTNSTFSGNFAITNGGGGGISNFGTGTLMNTIVANSPFFGGNCSDPMTDGGGNLSWPDTTCPGLNADPLLGPLQDNGGPTQTHALLAGSPAIDAALLANCPAADQRGVSRPQGAGCDIGAYEHEVAYNFSGFFQPVDNLPTLNVVQAGVGVPVRFSLSGDQGLDIFAAGYPATPKIVCNSGTPQDAIEETLIVGSSSLSYNAASDTYIYVWKTSKDWAGTCRQLNIRLNDGTEHKANFKFVR